MALTRATWALRCHFSSLILFRFALCRSLRTAKPLDSVRERPADAGRGLAFPAEDKDLSQHEDVDALPGVTVPVALPRVVPGECRRRPASRTGKVGTTPAPTSSDPGGARADPLAPSSGQGPSTSSSGGISRIRVCSFGPAGTPASCSSISPGPSSSETRGQSDSPSCSHASPSESSILQQAQCLEQMPMESTAVRPDEQAPAWRGSSTWECAA